ncbi:glycosyltransferase family 1 protein [soil metagenome]
MTARRVAFTAIGGADWTGGRNYLINVLRAVDRFESDRVRPVLFLGEDADASDAEPFLDMPNVEIVRSPSFNADRARKGLRNALLTGKNGGAVEAFQRSAVNVVFESATFYGWRLPLPAIAWQADFQHRRQPHNFTKRLFWRREAGFRAQIASGRTVMLSSEDARRDCEEFYPASIDRTTVVRFATTIAADQLLDDPRMSVARHGLPERFFYLPNQFWRHKNHAVVIEALSVLKRRGARIIVAASGRELDPRNPTHFESLRRRIDELGVAGDFHLLGMIPREDMISLMRTCTALLNPSLFEGWSTTVEEARALGVPTILSGIGVHKEQMGDAATYFDPSNPEQLADVLQAAATAAENLPLPARSASATDDHVRRFAADFASVVDRAYDRFSTRR